MLANAYATNTHIETKPNQTKQSGHKYERGGIHDDKKKWMV